jgi:hypothetical protein
MGPVSDLMCTDIQPSNYELTSVYKKTVEGLERDCSTFVSVKIPGSLRGRQRFIDDVEEWISDFLCSTHRIVIPLMGILSVEFLERQRNRPGMEIYTNMKLPNMQWKSVVTGAFRKALEEWRETDEDSDSDLEPSACVDGSPSSCASA